MREILFLAHRLPFPPDRGDRIRSWHILKAMAQHARVHVFALADSSDDLKHVAAVEQVAASVTVVVRRKPKSVAVAQALLTGRPASVAWFENKALKRAVEERAASVDSIYAFSGQMAAYVPRWFDGRFVMDFVDVDSAKFEARAGLAERYEAWRLRQWETRVGRRADLCLLVSQKEAELFSQRSRIDAQVLANGIDHRHFAPGAVEPQKVSGSLIVFTGQMDYAPNIEAVRDFARDDLPRIRAAVPEAKLAIVGRDPTAAVQALAGDGVIVTGEVPDTRPWLAAADVVIAPLRIARGVQNKVLEGMAMARAVVVSPAAAEGIDATDGEHFVIAEDPAASVIDLLRDRARADAMGRAARARIVERYDWHRQLAPLAGMLEP